MVGSFGFPLEPGLEHPLLLDVHQYRKVSSRLGAGASVYFAGITAGGTRTPVPYFSIVRVFMLYTSPGERT
jgi:hypothetical protein